MRLARTARLRRRREYLEVQQRGRRIYSGELLVIALDSGAPRPRIGITVSSKVGNAVERNRVKRWVREGWRAAVLDFPAVDVVVIARPAALEAGLAITTTSSGGRSCTTERQPSRIQRLMRLRSTALPTLDDTVIPIRGRGVPESSARITSSPE